MFCRKCGYELKEYQKFCPHCGMPIKEPNLQVQHKKSILNKGWSWVIIVGIVAVLFFGAYKGLMYLYYTSKISIYEGIGKNEAMPYIVSDKAYDFILDNEDLFPTTEKWKTDYCLDYGLDYKKVAKNPNAYGSKLMPVTGYVEDIQESIYDKTVYTDFVVSDNDGNLYDVIYLGKLEDVYEDTLVTVYGLPMDKSAYENIDGSYNEVIVLAGSYVRTAMQQN